MGFTDHQADLDRELEAILPQAVELTRVLRGFVLVAIVSGVVLLLS